VRLFLSFWLPHRKSGYLKQEHLQSSRSSLDLIRVAIFDGRLISTDNLPWIAKTTIRMVYFNMQLRDKMLEEMRAHLASLPIGELTDLHSRETIHRLSEFLERLNLEWEESTTGSKLLRAEDLRWDPPYLRFTLERHGSTVHGSTTASLHKWAFNTETGGAALERKGIRQIEKKAKIFDVKSVGKEIAKIITDHGDDPRISWHEDGAVQVHLSRATPSARQQTQSGRNKRLRQVLAAELAGAGWVPMPGSRCRFERK
jgi:hypothetical protein